MKETRLIKKLKQGSEKALRTFYNETAPKFKYLIYRYVGNEATAEDLLQDGYMRIMDKVSQFNGTGSFEGWARRIFVNIALEYLRKNKNRLFNNSESIEAINDDFDDSINIKDIDIDELPSDKVCMEVIYAAEFSDEDLEEALQQLPEHYRTVFNLFSIDGYKHKEIAEMLDINEKTSKSRLSKARKISQMYLYQKALEKVKKAQYEER